MANDSGSALSRTEPSAPSTSNLYSSPSVISGTNSSQTPELLRLRIGSRRPSQRLKSPTTRTPRAFGAQTAKATPGVPSMAIGRSEEHTSELQSRVDLVCRLLLEKKK